MQRRATGYDALAHDRIVDALASARAVAHWHFGCSEGRVPKQSIMSLIMNIVGLG